MSENPPVTITITRVVKPGCEGEFRAALESFVPASLSFPGHLGVTVLQPVDRDRRTYTVVLRFRSELQWRRFQEWPIYKDWRASIRTMLLEDPLVEKACGLEAWFRAPSQSLPPRYKMAILTFVVVYPLSLTLSAGADLLIPGFPHWVRAMILSAVMVASLTWLVMPWLSWAFRDWLHGEIGGRWSMSEREEAPEESQVDLRHVRGRQPETAAPDLFA